MKIKNVESYLMAEDIYEGKRETMRKFPKKMKEEDNPKRGKKPIDKKKWKYKDIQQHLYNSLIFNYLKKDLVV